MTDHGLIFTADSVRAVIRDHSIEVCGDRMSTHTVEELLNYIEHIEAENAHLKAENESLPGRHAVMCQAVREGERQIASLRAENESLSQRVIDLSTSVAEAQEEQSIQASLTETLAENESLRQELDNRTNGRWSADQVELTKLRGKQKMMEIALAADKRLRDDRATLMKDLRWLVDYWLANCDSGILGSRCNYTSVHDVSNRLAAMERSESQ